jgi:hypothetical protein
LHVPNRVETEAIGNSVADKLGNFGCALFGALCFDEEEVGPVASFWPLGHIASVYQVSIDHDSAFRGLPEYLGQAGNGDSPRLDNVGRDLTGANRRKLVNVADKQQTRIRRKGLQHGGHKRDIDHAGFVDDEKVAVEQIFHIAPEAAVLWIGFEQPVNGLCLNSSLFGHALRGAACLRCEEKSRSLGRENPQDHRGGSFCRRRDRR